MRTKILFIATLLSSVIQLNALEKQFFTVNVGDFTQLMVTDNVNVEYQCNPDSTGYAKFTAVPDMANQIIFSNNKKGKLTVSVGTDSVNAEKLPDIIVYSAYLQNADNQGEGTLKVVSVAPTPQLKIKLMGNGAIEVSNIVATSVDLEIFTGKGPSARLSAPFFFATLIRRGWSTLTRWMTLRAQLDFNPTHSAIPLPSTVFRAPICLMPWLRISVRARHVPFCRLYRNPSPLCVCR